jgi:1,4-alpha-glucan branching enzyme
MRLPRLMALAIAAAAVALAACAARRPLAATVTTATGVRFQLERADAGTVAVAGSFNDWSAALHPLVRERGRAHWTATVPLPPGEHLFMYVVDGTEWLSPPFAEDYVDDGFGAKNGVVVVRPSGR